MLVAAIGDSGLSIVAAPSVAEGLMTAAELSEQLLAMGYTQEDIDAALTALMPAEASTFDWTLYTLAQTDAEGVTVIEQNAYDALLASGVEPEFAVGTVPTAEPVATDAPATDAPATDAPATDAPATDAPATDAPATDAPATDAPATDAPATVAPAATPAPSDAVAIDGVPAVEVLPAIADGATLGVLLLPEDIEGAQPIGTLSAYLLANGYTADEAIDLVEQATAAHATCFVPFSPAADGSTIVDEAVLPALELAGIKGLAAGDVVTLASLGAKLTAAPTAAATEAPTEAPTAAPTEAPTEEPTAAPTEAPTEEPSAAPTEEPTAIPTEAPTEEPTLIPTEEPTEVPTEAPTEEPTEQPTEAPTEAPAASGLGAGGYFAIAAVLIVIGVALFLWSRKRKS